MNGHPHFGHTRLGLPVHARTADHAGTGINAKIGLTITAIVGTMICGYVFAAIALLSLPSAISSRNLTIIIAWVSSNFLQLVLLPVIIVGQNIQAKASDARAAKTFEDAEVIADRLDTRTQGGITDIMAALERLEQKL